MNIGIRDASGNMIFVGDILKNKNSGAMYKVMFSYYTHMESDTEAYGFWLYSENGVHPMPRCDDSGKIKLINGSRL